MNAEIHLSPTSAIRGGYYSYNLGKTTDADYGMFLTAHAYSSIYMYSSGFFSTYLSPQYLTDKGLGYSLRCLGR